jgi:hypothetical protein
VIQTSVRLFLKTGVHIERICKAAAIFLLYCNSNSHRTDSDGAAIQPTPSKIIPSASSGERKAKWRIPKEFFINCCRCLKKTFFSFQLNLVFAINLKIGIKFISGSFFLNTFIILQNAFKNTCCLIWSSFLMHTADMHLHGDGKRID